MKQPDATGQLFPDPDAVQKALEQRTRDALVQRLGSPLFEPPPTDSSQADQRDIFPAPPPGERAAARGIGFGADLVRAIIDGRKTQTRRLIRPLPTDTPPPATDCPAARPGELLYAREPWLHAPGGHTIYAADEIGHTVRKFRPAMYMARDVARLWLYVTSIRAERLQAITNVDLAAEGLPAGQSLAAVWDGFYPEVGHRYADDPWVWVIAFTVATD